MGTVAGGLEGILLSKWKGPRHDLESIWPHAGPRRFTALTNHLLPVSVL